VAITHVEIVVLHCDQGMGTLLKVYDDSVMNDLAYLALFDLGSDSKDWFFTNDALDTVMAALEEKYDHKLNALLISHQDYDHWSLLPNLRGMIDKSTWKKQFKLGQIYRGGLKWGADPSAEFDTWVKDYKVSGITWTDYVTDYTPAGKAGEITNYEDEVFIQLVIVNTPSRRKGEDLIRNGSSIVACVNYAGNRVLLPGDATSETLDAINDLWDAWDNKGKQLPIVPCIVLGVPHHGALRTIADNYNSKKPRLNIAEAFAENVEARRLAASAGFVVKYAHPSKRVLETLWTYRKDKEAAHDFVAYVEDKANWYQFHGVKSGLFTTIDTVADPPHRQNLITTLYPNGTFKFDVEILGPALPPLPPEHVVALPAEHLER
jgi:hypothetical protein